jgi:hypothetical protein
MGDRRQLPRPVRRLRGCCSRTPVARPAASRTRSGLIIVRGVRWSQLEPGRRVRAAAGDEHQPLRDLLLLSWRAGADPVAVAREPGSPRCRRSRRSPGLPDQRRRRRGSAVPSAGHRAGLPRLDRRPLPGATRRAGHRARIDALSHRPGRTRSPPPASCGEIGRVEAGRGARRRCRAADARTAGVLASAAGTLSAPRRRQRRHRHLCGRCPDGASGCATSPQRPVAPVGAASRSRPSSRTRRICSSSATSTNRSRLSGSSYARHPLLREALARTPSGACADRRLGLRRAGAHRRRGGHRRSGAGLAVAGGLGGRMSAVQGRQPRCAPGDRSGSGLLVIIGLFSAGSWR